VQLLSRANLYLVLALMLFVLLAGPTLYVVELFVSALGSYLQTLPRMSLYLDPGASSEWQVTWTLFYWGWWISWSPFVAIFVARISKGRTIKEFILGVLLVPVGLTFAWLAILGGTGLEAQRSGGADLLAAVNETESASLQAMLGTLPLATLSTILATVVILLFFVTSSDSGSLVDDMVTSGGDPDPPVVQRVFWAVSEGAVAVTLLLLGGLTAIRNAAISLGLPMSVLLVCAGVALWRVLRTDPVVRAHRRAARPDPAHRSG
jgi:choline/glycine/proline betaine transport protein